MADHPPRADRRAFLRTAGALAAGAAVPGVAAAGTAAPATHAPDAAGWDAAPAPRVALDRALLDALGEAVLPGALGRDGRRAAVAAFAAWVDGYRPVAEEMHGYGYAELRWLPADPAPGWQAQLAALDLLARRMHARPLAALAPDARRAVVEAALRDEPATRLPAPLAARHVAVALLAHWAASPGAWDLAFEARIAPGTCRVLADAPRRPLPLAGPSVGATPAEGRP